MKSRRSVGQTFAELRAAKRIAMMPFIPAGYPDLETTAAALPALEAAGADLIELGFPFSDPIADGPTIQEAFTAALAKVKSSVHDFQAELETRTAQEQHRNELVVAAVTGVGIVLGIVCAWLITRGVTRRITEVAGRLGSESDKANVSAAQVAEASQARGIAISRA